MKQVDNRISSTQLLALYLMMLFQVNALAVPGILAAQVKTDAVTAVVIASLLASAVIYLISLMSLRHSGLSVMEYGPRLLGWPGKILVLVLPLSWFYEASMQLRILSDFVKIFLLDRTPEEVIMMLLLVSTVYLGRMGIESIARFMTLMIPFAFLPYLLVLGSATFYADFQNVLPFFRSPPLDLLRSVAQCSMYFPGLSILLVLHPLVKDRARAGSLALAGTVLAGLLQIGIVTMSIGVFGGTETAHLEWAGVSLIKVMDVPGVVLQRLDVLFVPVWIIAGYTTLVVLLWAISQSLAVYAGYRDYVPFILILVPLTYFLARVPSSIVDLLSNFSFIPGIAYTLLCLGTVAVLLAATLIKGGR